MYKTFIFKGLLTLLLLVGATTITRAQSDNSDLNTAWSLNANLGPSLLWGDMSDNSNIFSKMFSDQMKFSYGLVGRKGLNNVFGVNVQVIVGDVKGVRNEWSDGTPTGGFTSETFFTEFNANLDVDIMNIFSPKDMRLVNPYVKGGVGMTYFKANVTYQGTDYAGSEKSTLAIPFGAGLRFDISRRIGITLETTISMLASDWFDGFSTENSEANDYYTYTSIGLTYRFVPKEQKKESSYDEDAIEEAQDDVAADDNGGEEAVVAVVPVDTVKKVKYVANATIPSEIFQGDTFIVAIHITKGENVTGNMKIQQTLPQGYTATANESAGARFEFTNQTVNLFWSEAPAGEQIEITYTAVAVNAALGEVTIPGLALYTEDNVDKIKNFSNTLNVKSFAGKNQMMTVTYESPLLYRVQVQAIYGGKTTAQDIKRRYGIDKEVHVDYEAGYAKYTVGGFDTYEKAREFRDNLRKKGVQGAFVVGYYDGSRIHDIKQAVEIEKSGKKVAVLAPASTAVANKDIYSIQIAASPSNKSTHQIQSKYHITDKVDKTFTGGLYKYTVGKYTDYGEAKEKLNELKSKIPEAFIISTKK